MGIGERMHQAGGAGADASAVGTVWMDAFAYQCAATTIMIKHLISVCMANVMLMRVAHRFRMRDARSTFSSFARRNKRIKRIIFRAAAPSAIAGNIIGNLRRIRPVGPRRRREREE